MLYIYFLISSAFGNTEVFSLQKPCHRPRWLCVSGKELSEERGLAEDNFKMTWVWSWVESFFHVFVIFLTISSSCWNIISKTIPLRFFLESLFSTKISTAYTPWKFFYFFTIRGLKAVNIFQNPWFFRNNFPNLRIVFCRFCMDSNQLRTRTGGITGRFGCDSWRGSRVNRILFFTYSRKWFIFTPFLYI